MFLTDEERSETIWACRFCMMCHAADNISNIIGRESYTPRGRAAILEAYEKGVIEMDESFTDIMYTTLNDGSIREWCLSHYDYEELIIDTRARIYKKGYAPDSVNQFVNYLRSNNGNHSPSNILSQAGIDTNPDGERFPLLLRR
jgi:Fe-S oxidoreductase